MRASYALPGIFRPVAIDGRWLFDGALVNPIPVSVCRALGARYVIAVNVNSDTCGRGTVVPHMEGSPSAEQPAPSRTLARRRRHRPQRPRREEAAAAPVLRPHRQRPRHLAA